MSKAKPTPGRTSRRPRSTPIPELEVKVRALASELKRSFPGVWRNSPLALRDQAVVLLRRALTPRKRLSGARRTHAVDLAYRMWRDQLRECRRRELRRVSWLKIARACIDGFKSMDAAERRRRIRRLQNAVYNRSHRAWKRLNRLRAGHVDAHNGAAASSA